MKLTPSKPSHGEVVKRKLFLNSALPVCSDLSDGNAFPDS